MVYTKKFPSPTSAKLDYVSLSLRTLDPLRGSSQRAGG